MDKNKWTKADWAVIAVVIGWFVGLFLLITKFGIV